MVTKYVGGVLVSYKVSGVSVVTSVGGVHVGYKVSGRGLCWL